jgi:hypothetical protein
MSKNSLGAPARPVADNASANNELPVLGAVAMM